MKKYLLIFLLTLAPTHTRAVSLPQIPEALSTAAHWLISAGPFLYGAGSMSYYLLSPEKRDAIMGDQDASQEAHTFVHDIFKEMGFKNPENIKVKWSKPHLTLVTTIDICSVNDTVYLGKGAFELLPKDMLRFLIGREAQKIKKHDAHKRILGHVIIPFITHEGVKWQIAGLQKIRDYLALDENSMLAKAFNINEYVAKSSLGKLMISLYLYSWLSQYLEKDADIASAKKLKTAQEGITIFNALHTTYGHRENHFDFANPSLKKRVAYLKPIAKKQAIKFR